ncbi:MAG: hypothetical protein JWO36_6191 [Myxococcales bacterium]|nr:hypothetical protein [Myxococcales bacterium]
MFALCACNQIFGLKQVVERDAGVPFFDGAPDAPYACPPYGQRPFFGHGLFEAVAQRCTSYAIGGTDADPHAMGLCSDPNVPVGYGPADAPLSPVAFKIPDMTTLRSVRLAPEGDLAVVTIDNPYAPLTSFEVYKPTADAWTSAGVIATATYGCFGCAPVIVSTPTRGPNRHVVAYDYNQKLLFELEDQGAYPWVQVSAQAIGDLGPMYIGSPISLSADGLRMVFYANAGADFGIYYADRMALSSPFEPAVWLSNLPHTSGTDPFLTQNCSRLYISGLDSVFFAKQ